MSEIDARTIELACPCCGATLTLDTALGRVISHEAPHRPPKAPELSQAGEFLQQEAARREAHFRQSADAEKVKSQLLERRFEEALKKNHGTSIERPLREIDLD